MHLPHTPQRPYLSASQLPLEFQGERRSKKSLAWILAALSTVSPFIPVLSSTLFSTGCDQLTRSTYATLFSKPVKIESYAEPKRDSGSCESSIGIFSSEEDRHYLESKSFGKINTKEAKELAEVAFKDGYAFFEAGITKDDNFYFISADRERLMDAVNNPEFGQNLNQYFRLFYGKPGAIRPIKLQQAAHDQNRCPGTDWYDFYTKFPQPGEPKHFFLPTNEVSTNRFKKYPRIDGDVVMLSIKPQDSNQGN